MAQDGWGAAVEIRRPAARPAKPRAAATTSEPARTEPPSARAASRAPLSTAASTVFAAALAGDGRLTRIGFDMTAQVNATARSRAEPPQVIIDLPEVDFQLPAGTGARAGGLVKGFRYGLIEAGKSRIVLDTAGPVLVDKVAMEGPYPAGTWRLVLDLLPSTAAELKARELADAAREIRPELPAAPPPRASGEVGQPVVVIDAGHGGIDSGAAGAGRLEKDVVLDVALEVARLLKGMRRYRVVTTRETDVFVSLDDRVRLSSEHKADLFVSIHADSLPTREFARSVRGATVYTLSETASDDLAHRMAEKENAADLLAGVPSAVAGDNQVRSILIDLMRRESAAFSGTFQRSLVRELKARIQLSKQPFRSGPFRVLRQAGTPAVLVELGYMSNAEDERLMATQAWQAKVAGAIARAVDEHLRRRHAGKK
jgi:N-acetylmuramoyl-L-alanine amidase